MFNINKRKAFLTVGDLRALMNDLPAETRVCICGDANCFYHEEQDGSTICLDCEDLQEYYDENDASSEESTGTPRGPCTDRAMALAEVESCVTVKIIITNGIVSGVLANKKVNVEIVDIDDDYEDYEALCRYEDDLRSSKTLQDCDFTVVHFEGKSGGA